MRSHSLQSLFAFSSLLSVAAAGEYPTTTVRIHTEIEVVWVTAYVTTCPSPPPPCAVETGGLSEHPSYPESSPVYPTIGTETDTEGAVPTGYPTESPCSDDESSAASTSYEAPTGYPTSYPTDIPTYPTETTCDDDESTAAPTSYEVPTSYPTYGPTDSTDFPTEFPTSYPPGMSSESSEFPTGFPTTTYPTSGWESSEYPTSSKEASSEYPTSSVETSSEYPTYSSETSTEYPTSSIDTSEYPTYNTSETSTGYPTTSETSTEYPTTSSESSSYYPTSTTSETKSSSSTTSSTYSPTITSSTSSSTSSSSSSSTTSSSTTSSIPPAACTDYWLSKIKKQGVAPYAGAGYKVFRNVKTDYGAKGDGVTDDTVAIQKAISDGNRCNPQNCQSTTTTPALVYFPPGTYIVSAPLIDFYLTNLIGNPDCMPVLKASANFNGQWVIDGSFNHIWTSANIFWRQVRNFVIDTTAVSGKVVGIHWPTGQATTLQNIVFKMSTTSGTEQQGLFIEDGSGGFVTDLVFHGGAQGMAVGNQQFTMRNISFDGCKTAIQQAWDWGWTYKGVSINNCDIGLDMAAGAPSALSVASVVFTDSDIKNTRVFVKTGKSASSQPAAGNSLIIENVRLSNVQVAVQGPSGTLLPGTAGQTTIAAWGQGHAYGNTGRVADLTGPNLKGNTRPGSLLAGNDYYFRSKPQYEKVPVSQFMSVRDGGAKGNGVTDDTAALNAVIAAATAAGKIVFIDYGVYVVTGTIKIPAGARITGESLPIILSSGAFFNDMAHPKPVVQVGTSGSTGTVEWSDVVVSSRGQQAGAILIEWNLSSPGTPSGMWDVHTRVGGFAGSNQLFADCPKTPERKIPPNSVDQDCIVAFMSIHITASASHLYMENCWFWVADHDIEDPGLRQITLYAGRGMLVESTHGPIWMYGTAVEHHQLYEYQLTSTQNVVMGQIQTETAYYQPNPDATIPFPVNAAYHDPVLPKGSSGWGLRVSNSDNVFVYGAGLYSFFINNDNSCANTGNSSKCQSRIFQVENSAVSLYNLNTVGARNMITVGNTDVALYSDNDNGFPQTIALFRSTKS